MNKALMSIFLRTAGWSALAVLTAAEGYDWASETFVANSRIVGFGLLGAVVAGLIAVGWSFVASPAATAMGKALRQAVQVLLGLPIAGIIIDASTDFVSIEKLIVPTLVAVVLAFLAAYLANKNPAPQPNSVPVSATRTVSEDFAKGSGA